MNQIAEYIIVTNTVNPGQSTPNLPHGEYYNVLQDIVNQYIKDGWIPQGGLFVDGAIISQAMIRYADTSNGVKTDE